MSVNDTEARADETTEQAEEERAKYSADDRKQMAKEGKAMPDGSYPIADKEDLQNAIHAVGRGGSDHNTIRKHIIKRAGALGASDMIPDNWNSDGSLKQNNSAQTPLSRRRRERRRAVPLMPEVRHFRATGLEVRENTKTNELVISGSPIVYDADYTVTDMFGQFTERMMPGVAQNVLPDADVRFLFNHDGLPLARTTSGTLSLQDSDDALLFTARLDARQQLANDLAIAIERGDVSQMSCGFVVARDEWDDAMEDRSIFELADLLDVSAVTYPASPTTSIAVAKRMALEVPVESRARLRMVYADLRETGRTTPERAEALRSVLDVTLDPGEDLETPEGTGRLGHPDGDGKTYANPEDGDNMIPPDGTASGSVADVPNGPVQDGTGSRSSKTSRAARLKLKRASRGI